MPARRHGREDGQPLAAHEMLRLPRGSVGFAGTMASFTAAARNAVLAQAGWDVEVDGLPGAASTFLGADAHATSSQPCATLGLGAARSARPLGHRGADGAPALGEPWSAFRPSSPGRTNVHQRLRSMVSIATLPPAWRRRGRRLSALAPGARRATAGIGGRLVHRRPPVTQLPTTAATRRSRHRRTARAMSIDASYLPAAVGAGTCQPATRRAVAQRPQFAAGLLRAMGRQGVARWCAATAP